MVDIPVEDEWGLAELTVPFVPELEIVESVLATPELEIDFPVVFAQARKFKKLYDDAGKT